MTAGVYVYILCMHAWSIHLHECQLRTGDCCLGKITVTMTATVTVTVTVTVQTCVYIYLHECLFAVLLHAQRIQTWS